MKPEWRLLKISLADALTSAMRGLDAGLSIHPRTEHVGGDFHCQLAEASGCTD